MFLLRKYMFGRYKDELEKDNIVGRCEKRVLFWKNFRFIE